MKDMTRYVPQAGNISILSTLLDMILNHSKNSAGVATAGASAKIKRTASVRYFLNGVHQTALGSIASVVVGSTYALPAGYGVKLLLTVAGGTMVCTRGTAVSAANGGATAAVLPAVPRSATTGLIKSVPFAGITLKSLKATAVATLGTNTLNAAGSLTVTYSQFTWPTDGDSALASGIL